MDERDVRTDRAHSATDQASAAVGVSPYAAGGVNATIGAGEPGAVWECPGIAVGGRWALDGIAPFTLTFNSRISTVRGRSRPGTPPRTSWS